MSNEDKMPTAEQIEKIRKEAETARETDKLLEAEFPPGEGFNEIYSKELASRPKLSNAELEKRRAALYDDDEEH